MAATKVAFINVSVFTQFPSSSPAYHHRVTQCVTIMTLDLTLTLTLTLYFTKLFQLLNIFSQYRDSPWSALFRCLYCEVVVPVVTVVSEVR